MSLTFRRVHEVRTIPLPDTVYARRWRVTRGTVQRARIGKTWREHPTAADTKRRSK